MSYSQQILSALCHSPLFLDNLPEGSTFDRTYLNVPENPQPLNPQQKLGHLYEDGLLNLIEASTRYDVLEKGLQLQRDRTQTIGELDFLLRDKTSGQLIHLELAVKFYLAIETSGELLLPGPNSRDNYYNKLDRLRTHQLTLGNRFRQLLPSTYQTEPLISNQLTIGCLFDHISAPHKATPRFLHPLARRGLWLRQEEFISHFPKNPRPLMIPKPLWPVEENSIGEHQCEPLDLTSPLTRCTLVKLPSLTKPVFITPDEYPQQT